MSRISPATEPAAPKKPPGSGSVELLFFVALNALVVPFSTYQTFVGYEKDVAGNAILALIVALISGVLFLAMNFGIRQSRLKGEKYYLKVLMYIIPLGLSFFGNFNAFYSNQMKDSLLRSEINDYRLTLTKTKDIAVSEIKNSIGLNDLETNFESLKISFLNEYGEKPKGWGKNCSKIWNELTAFLNKEGGSIDANIISGIGNEQVKFNKALSFANGAYESIVKLRESKINTVLDQVQSSFATVDNDIDSLINLPKPIYRSSMLDKMVTAENIIRSQTESFLGSQDLFSHNPLESSNENELGTIKHSFNSAFIKGESFTATAFSLFLSLIIDFSALIYILVFTPYNRIKKLGGRVRSGGPKTI